MHAMRLHAARSPLVPEDLPDPRPGRGEVLVEVTACGVCRTDLHIADGELPGGNWPLTPGHEVVGRVLEAGEGATRFAKGERVGIPWLAWTCGECEYCRTWRENLCARARFTGFDVPGGYATRALADERYCVPIPERYGDAEAAPLLCAGMIGYRSYAKAGDARSIGLYGFGAAAHILAQVARAEGRRVFAFTRKNDLEAQKFALQCGAHWAGDSESAPPEPLDAAILFAPVGALVPLALRAVKKGGAVICGGIHMSDIPPFAYSLLWGERRIESVANLTRADAERFMALAAHVRVRTDVSLFPLDKANEALDALRAGHVQGAAVLTP